VRKQYPLLAHPEKTDSLQHQVHRSSESKYESPITNVRASLSSSGLVRKSELVVDKTVLDPKVTNTRYIKLRLEKYHPVPLMVTYKP